MNEFERLFDITGLSLDRLRTFLRVVEAGNLTKAALGDVTKQSQFSRQIKELEGFFGVALTRRVGRRIEITDEGQRLALVIHRHFRELDDFRESMAGRSVTVRIGTQGSIVDWLLLPRLGAIREALGNVVIETAQLRTLDVVRAVSDGRLDFGIIRRDAVPKGMKYWPLGKVGYAVFAANSLWRWCRGANDLLNRAPVAELQPGGQFSSSWREWINNSGLRPKVVTRVTSFTDLARVVRAGYAAAVLPEMAACDFDMKQIRSENIPKLNERQLVLICNNRSLECSGLDSDVVNKLSAKITLINVKKC